LPGLLTYNSILFATYGQTANYFNPNPSQLKLHEIGVSGAVSGAIIAAITCPIELIRSRLQVQYDSPSSLSYLKREEEKEKNGKRKLKYFGPIDCVRKTISLAGHRGLYKGFMVTILREIPSNATYFMTFEAFLRYFGYGSGYSVSNHTKNNSNNISKNIIVKYSEASPLMLLAAGGLAGVMNWVVIFPIDTIKSRFQTDNLFQPKYQSATHCLKQTIEMQGYKSLWRGISPCLLRAFIANGAGFLAINTARKIVYN